MINLGTKRECFFDDFFFDKEKTTARLLPHQAQIKEVGLTFTDDWESDGISYPHFFYDEGIYKMYYVAYAKSQNEGEAKPTRKYHIAYAESKDAINWVKPKLGICEWKGSKENNIVVDSTFDIKPFIDNMYVFRDDNPDCPPDRKYKGICSKDSALWAFYSEDGLHFRTGCKITDRGAFDTLNIILWDNEAKLYRGYIRGFHEIGDLEGKDEFDERPLELPDDVRNLRVRDIRYIESKDFESWTRPKLLIFKGKKDIPLYTNNVTHYDRAPHIFIGFPTRYVERPGWSKAYDVLCGKEERLEAMKEHPRIGLAITDCIFMCSRDGVNFTRYDKAYITPGVEHDYNWVYGDGYPSHGFIKTPSHVSPNADYELSFYCMGNHRSAEPSSLVRYSIRQDGFCSLNAGEKEEVVVTKPFSFEGSKLFANISTSAAGYLYFEIKSLEDGKVIKSCEMFGDKIDKEIGFDEDISLLSGKEVVMIIRMYDADIYSIKFEK